MFQLEREKSVSKLIADLRAGAPRPSRTHIGARVYFAEAVANAQPKTCVVCAVPLLGRQSQVCAGHWDWLLFEPLENFEFQQDPTWSLIEFLTINLSSTYIWHNSRHWMAGLKGHSTCEVCMRITLHFEELRTVKGGCLKRHTVCPEHSSFRTDSCTPDSHSPTPC